MGNQWSDADVNDAIYLFLDVGEGLFADWAELTVIYFYPIQEACAMESVPTYQVGIALVSHTKWAGGIAVFVQIFRRLSWTAFKKKCSYHDW